MAESAAVRTILIDTDTASDDAIALIMALRSPRVRVAAITVVAGNVALEQAVRNALYVVELCRASVPVYAGAAKPLSRPLEIADWFHGVDGLGDHGYAPLHATPHPTHGVEAIIETALANPGLEIITLGPLTNLALALNREPRIVSNISRCVVMGGAPCCEGNVTPAAEFNIWSDPEAANLVLRSGLSIELIGWQLCRHQAVVKPEEINAILALDTPFASFAIESNSIAVRAYYIQTGEHGISLPDPVAMAILLDPALKKCSSRHRIEVETHSDLTRGMTVVDRLNVAQDDRNRAFWGRSSASAEICWEIDIDGWKAALVEALR